MIKPLEISIKELIADGGLLGSWTDYRGNTQPAPKVQLYELDEFAKGIDESDLIMLIRNVGSGSGNFLVREPQMAIVVFADTAKTKTSLAKHYIELVKQWVSRNYRKDCIMSVNIVGDVAGPYPMQSGRRYFELNLSVITDTGESI